MSNIVVPFSSKYRWELVFDYDNSGNTGTITQEVSYTKSSSYNSKSFTQEVSSEAKKLASSHSVEVEAGFSWGPVSASVKAGYSASKEVTTSLENTSKNEVEETSSYSETEKRTYKIGANSKLCLYQRVYIGPGITVRESVLRTTPTPLKGEELEEVIPIEITLAPKRFLKGIKVVTSTRAIDAPADRIRDVTHKSDDINNGYSESKFVWLVPELTHKLSEALTDLDLVITSSKDERYNDLAAGAGGDWRYLVPQRNPNSQFYITDSLALRRSKEKVSVKFPVRSSGDINNDRGGDYLYLEWAVERAIAV